MMPEANKELADQIKRCLDCSFQDNQDPLRDSAFVEEKVMLCLSLSMTNDPEILKCAPLTLIGSIVRCLCVACQQDASVESALIAWRGARKPPKVGVDESIFSKDTTANDEIMLKLNEHRLGTQCLLGDVESDRNNLASILCHLWRCNMERLIGDDLRESGLRPVSADRRQLQQAEEIAKIRGEGIRSKKMAILRAANDADAWLEAECCNLVDC
ncbi:unnamed protein product [Mesocestoides corti]|uniref:Uncharacterized protein n=1 Tax=Mesocestoides corti TaxID=53468 RepID=A0A0R3UJT8_MESCO|nr:unnamed protein product [Mesocestoides corti]